MKFTLKKKVLAGGVATVLALGSAVAAYAYFTNSGSGTGSAAVGTSTAVTLAGTITGSLYPAGAPASVSVLVTNPGTGSQLVTAVHLASITADSGHSTCVVTSSGVNAAFTMSDITVGTTLTKTGTAGDHTTVSGSLQMNDTGIVQDTCQGATLTLNLTSN